MNEVLLKVNGNAYYGWHSVEIKRSMESISGSFDLSLTPNNPSNPIQVNKGDACTVWIDNNLVLTGFVDDKNYKLNKDEHTLEISGRDASGDLVDCSAINSPGQWKNQSLENIVNDLISPFDISLSVQVDTGEDFPDFSIHQGDSVFECISRLCKMNGILCISDPSGNLILTRAGINASSSSLAVGKNILDITVTESAKDLYSQILVKGQSAGDDLSHGKTKNSANGSTTDSKITRYRPLLIIADGQMDNTKCQQRALWERTNRLAKAKKVTVTVQGWEQDNGQLWDLNQLIRVMAPDVEINQTLLIASITFKKDSNGTLTDLELTPKDAFTVLPEQEKVKKTKRKKKKKKGFDASDAFYTELAP